MIEQITSQLPKLTKEFLSDHLSALPDKQKKLHIAAKKMFREVYKKSDRKQSLSSVVSQLSNQIDSCKVEKKFADEAKKIFIQILSDACFSASAEVLFNDASVSREGQEQKLRLAIAEYANRLSDNIYGEAYLKLAKIFLDNGKRSEAIGMLSDAIVAFSNGKYTQSGIPNSDKRKENLIDCILLLAGCYLLREYPRNIKPVTYYALISYFDYALRVIAASNYKKIQRYSFDLIVHKTRICLLLIEQGVDVEKSEKGAQESIKLLQANSVSLHEITYWKLKLRYALAKVPTDYVLVCKECEKCLGSCSSGQLQKNFQLLFALARFNLGGKNYEFVIQYLHKNEGLVDMCSKAILSILKQKTYSIESDWLILRAKLVQAKELIEFEKVIKELCITMKNAGDDLYLLNFPYDESAIEHKIFKEFYTDRLQASIAELEKLELQLNNSYSSVKQITIQSKNYSAKDKELELTKLQESINKIHAAIINQKMRLACYSINFYFVIGMIDRANSFLQTAKKIIDEVEALATSNQLLVNCKQILLKDTTAMQDYDRLKSISEAKELSVSLSEIEITNSEVLLGPQEVVRDQPENAPEKRVSAPPLAIIDPKTEVVDTTDDLLPPPPIDSLSISKNPETTEGKAKGGEGDEMIRASSNGSMAEQISTFRFREKTKREKVEPRNIPSNEDRGDLMGLLKMAVLKRNANMRGESDEEEHDSSSDVDCD